MKKNYFLLLIVLIAFSGKGFAQLPCSTDEMHQRMLKEHPELVKAEADYEKQLAEGLKKIDLKLAHKTTTVDESGNVNFWYDIPIVIHVVHDYGPENLSDDAIFADVQDWNVVYAKQNYDTASVIPAYIKYIGNPHIRLHLATKDPNGRPTRGITRHRNYLTYNGGEQAKYDDWPPTSYVNIWSIYIIQGSAAAYAHFPSDVNDIPYWDGVISDYTFMANDYTGATTGGISKAINHELGHVFSLLHPWGNNNSAAVACGDDLVDDTPPTTGHLFTLCAADRTSLYDTTCARNYFKIYPNVAGGDSLVDYPDTVNSQNNMDYTYCARMFTKGQVARMHAALNSDVAGRNNLWTMANLLFTGVVSDTVAGTFTPRRDLKPIPEFNATVANVSPSQYMRNMEYFTFPGVNVTFHNETWNDTLTSLVWNFSNTAANPTWASASHPNALTTFTNSFTDPGWVDLKMTATGNNTGDTTVEWPRAVFVANATGTNAATYYQDFNGVDTAQWPSFNYYNNEFKWKWANVGYADNSSIQYQGFDTRLDPSTNTYPVTGSPLGDFDDFFSVPMDLSSFTSGYCSLNYFYSGATRSANGVDMNDTLEIDYSINKSQSWTTLSVLTKGQIDNKGAVSTAYVPTSMSDWAQMSINIPAAARTPYTVFRFRYKPSVGQGNNGSFTYWPGSYSSGNNFYMDRIYFSPFPAGVANVKVGNMDVAVAPNPTNGDAYVIIKDAENAVANIIVTDITGKEVFKTTEQLIGSEAHVLIPHASIAVPGMYLVQTITGNQVQTRKLVVQ